MKASSRFLFTVLVVLLSACAHHKDETASPAATGRLDLDKDGTAYVAGKVVDNKSDCTLDTCYLTVATEARQVRVLYGSSTSPCLAGKDGAGLQSGDDVKAYGRYGRDADFGIIDVCTGRGGFLEKK